jgi:hypothetical protein
MEEYCTGRQVTQRSVALEMMKKMKKKKKKKKKRKRRSY